MKNKPSVVVFLNSFWAGQAGISGGDQIVVQLLKQQRDRFDRVVVVTSAAGQHLLEGVASDLTFVRTDSDGDCLGLFPSYVLRTWRALLRLRTLRQVDVLFTASDFFPDVVPSRVLQALRGGPRWLQCVFHVYPDWRTRPGSKLRSFVAQWLQRLSFRLIRRADGVLVINTQVGDHLAGLGIRQDRIGLQYLGINLDEIASARSDDPRGYDGVFLARLAPSKGIFDLPRIWAKVVARQPGLRLGIIGGGGEPIREELRQACRQAGVADTVELLGFLPNEAAFAILKRSRVFLFPSHEEGFGLAIAEAMACGLPAVAWDLSVYREIFGETIRTAREGDINVFSDHVGGALNASASEREAGREFVRRYSWPESTRRIADQITASAARG